jgi:hypothetical protein
MLHLNEHVAEVRDVEQVIRPDRLGALRERHRGHVVALLGEPGY